MTRTPGGTRVLRRAPDADVDVATVALRALCAVAAVESAGSVRRRRSTSHFTHGAASPAPNPTIAAMMALR